MNRRIHRRKRIWVRELTVKAKEKRSCRRERRICPNIRPAYQQNEEINRRLDRDAAPPQQGEGNGDGVTGTGMGMRKTMTTSRWNMRSRQLDAWIWIDRCQNGAGAERLSPCPVSRVPCPSGVTQILTTRERCALLSFPISQFHIHIYGGRIWLSQSEQATQNLVRTARVYGIRLCRI